jgi:hypothetical protein
VGIVRSVMKLAAGIVFFIIALIVLIALFELPPFVIALILGPMHPELAQVYTMFEIGLIVCILIFGLPKGYAWFNKRWNEWTGKRTHD